MSYKDESDTKLEGAAADETSYKTIERVTANPTAKAYIDTAVHLYEKVKESSPMVKSALEMVETTAEKTVGMIPVSVLETADAVGVVGLDKLAEGSEKLAAAYEYAKENLGEKMIATDEYLKGVPVVSSTANTALDAGEAITNRVFPEKKDKEEEKQGGEKDKKDKKEDEKEREDGPLFRAGKLSYRVTEQTLAAVRNMSLKDLPSTGVKSAHLVVDLLADAALTLEASAKGVTNSVTSRIPTKEELNQVFQSGTSDAVGRLTAALQVISTRIAETPIATKALETPIVSTVVDSEFYKQNAERLRDAGKTLGEHVEKGDVPAFVYESVATIITNVRDSLTQREAAKNSTQ